MTISDLIDQLDRLREQHGEVPVYLNRYSSIDEARGTEFDRTGMDMPDSIVPAGSVVIW